MRAERAPGAAPAEGLLSGQVILVSDDTDGLGAAIAADLGAERAAVALHAGGGSPVGLELSREGDRSSPPGPTLVSADLRRPGEAGAALAEVTSALGAPHTLVMCVAGPHRRLRDLPSAASFIDLEPGDFSGVNGGDLSGELACVQAAVESFVHRKPGNRPGSLVGRVILVAPPPGDSMGAEGISAELARDRARSLVRVLARELGPWGISVNGVVPGVLSMSVAGPAEAMVRRAPLHVPGDRYTTHADVSAAVAFLASAGGEHLHGQILEVDGGLRPC